MLYRKGDDEQVMTKYQCMIRQQLLVFEATPLDVEMSKSPGRCGMAVVGQVGLKCKWCNDAVVRSLASSKSKLKLKSSSSSPNDDDGEEEEETTAIFTKGSVYYSKSIIGLYQIAQNMGRLHLLDRCTHIPPEVRKSLAKTRNDGGFYGDDGNDGNDTSTAAAAAFGGDGRGKSYQKKKIPSRAKPLGGKRYWADSLAQLGLYESKGFVWVKRRQRRPNNRKKDDVDVAMTAPRSLSPHSTPSPSSPPPPTTTNSNGISSSSKSKKTLSTKKSSLPRRVSGF